MDNKVNVEQPNIDGEENLDALGPVAEQVVPAVAGSAQPLAEVVIDHVRVSGRARELGPIEQLVESIKTVGLMQPIVIDSSGALISGYHRLEACRKLGWKKIPARVLDLDELHRELAEIDENFVRNELTALDRGKQFARRKEIFETLYPQTRHGAAPGRKGGGKETAAKDPGPGSFVDATAKATKRGRSTIAEETALGKKITDEAAALIRNEPIADNKTELKKLAMHSADDQVKIAKDLVDKKTKSVPKPPEEKNESSPDPAPAIFENQGELEEVVSQLGELEALLASIDVAWRDEPGPDVSKLRPRVAHSLKTVRALKKEAADQWVPQRACDLCPDPKKPKRQCKRCGGSGWLSLAVLSKGRKAKARK